MTFGGGIAMLPILEREIIDKKNINLQTFITDNFYSNDGYNSECNCIYIRFSI